MDEAALKVLKAAEDTKQVLQQKEEVLAEIRGEFEQKSREVRLCTTPPSCKLADMLCALLLAVSHRSGHIPCSKGY